MITTTFVYPPIPIRSFDYCATFDGNDEGLRGWGKTEAEAIADLQEQEAEHHMSECTDEACPRCLEWYRDVQADQAYQDSIDS